ncbi:MAG: DUF3261 domain-containing protein [Gammaproteobacteria bacterium]|nr:DUF3261 domain-containing protein [Gammaproteobacteria bacterium]
MKLMKVAIFVLFTLLTGCQSLPQTNPEHEVFLAKDISYQLQTVASSGLTENLTQKVKYIGPDGKSLDYLIQISIEQQHDYLSLVATNLMGVPLISFEVEGVRVANASKIAAELPEPQRILADLQFMYWPLESFASLRDYDVTEFCETSCQRQILYKKRPIMLLSYKQNKLVDELHFKNLIHGYQMQIKNL